MSKKTKDKHAAETRCALKSRSGPPAAGREGGHRDCERGYKKPVLSECHAFRLQEEQAMKEE